MTRLLVIPLLAAILALSSCVLSGKNAAKTSATPAAPPAAAAAKPPTPPPPLSTPQTEIQLPPPQAVSAAALATIPAVREELPAPAPDEPEAKPPAKRPPAAANAPKPESPAPVAETPSPPQGPTPPTTTPAEEQPRLQPVYPEEERRRIWGMLEKRRGDIEVQLRNSQNRMSAEQKSVVERIRSFLDQAEDMAKRGDFRSAEALSDRAAILARDVASGR